MSDIEVRRRFGSLDACEAVIDAGRETYLDVGYALLEIKEDHHWKQNDAYESFDDYCQTRHNFGARRARYLMKAAAEDEARTNVPRGTNGTIVPREFHARALADVDTASVPAVLAKAEELAGDGKVTARIIEQAKAEVLEPPAEEPEPELTPLESVQADFAELERLVRAAKNFALKAFKPWNDENMSTRDYCKGVSQPSSVGHLNDYLRWLKDMTPIGGTPKRPETNRSKRAAEAAAK